MLKKEIAYEDYDGNQRVETFYFNLTKTELVELELSLDKGLTETLKAMIRAEKVGEVLGLFKKIILQSVGIKSDDGKRFVKSTEIAQDFIASPAFDVLFMELITDTDKVAIFIKGIIPQGMVAEYEKSMADSTSSLGDVASLKEIPTA